jgi:integrase
VELPVRQGRRNRLRRGGFPSRAAAARAQAYWLAKDVDPDPSLVTVGQWLDVWLETRYELRPNTRRICTQHVRHYLRPGLGNVLLKDLTVGRVQAMFTKLLRSNGTGHKQVSPATVQRIRGVLRAALNGAIRRGLLTQNPARWAELPSGRRPRAVVWTDARVAVWKATGQRPAVAVWTVDQTARFLAHVRGAGLYPLFHLVALLGLRRGEVIGLRWCDVDLKGRTLMVSHQVQEVDGRGVVCPPKSDASVRTVALDLGTVTMLRHLRTKHRSAIRGNPQQFIFLDPRGNPISPGFVSHAFARSVAEAGLPPIRFHDLRHGAASLSLAAGNELKTVQALLGHDSIVLTADTYTSVLPCLGHAAAEATARLVMDAEHRMARARRTAPAPTPRSAPRSPNRRPLSVIAHDQRLSRPSSDPHGLTQDRRRTS